jgi:hypothetical protein
MLMIGSPGAGKSMLGRGCPRSCRRCRRPNCSALGSKLTKPETSGKGGFLPSDAEENSDER